MTELGTRTFVLNWSATTLWLLSSFAGTFPRCRWWLTSLDVGHNYDQREKWSRRPRTTTPQDAAKSGSGQRGGDTGTDSYESGALCLCLCMIHSYDCERRSCVAPLNVKTTLNVKTAKCEKPNNR